MAEKDLTTQEGSKYFYEKRYSDGYMEEWPINQRRRVMEIIRSIGLPEYGEALDFGCGNGIFTNVIKEALPHWDVYGCDISEKAIQNSSNRFPKCTFFVNSDERCAFKKFDFILTNHVLEHVYDITEVAKQVSVLAKNRSKMLHILPCGNPGSFEYYVCLLRNGGIDAEMGNRFFYEDEGHIRRLTTAEVKELFWQHDFLIRQGFYSNQFFGAINWISKSDFRLFFNMFNPLRGKKKKDKIKLLGMIFGFLLLKILRMPNYFYSTINRPNKVKARFYSLFRSVLLFLPAAISKCFDDFIESLARKEWNRSKTQKNGSEMYLFFERERI